MNRRTRALAVLAAGVVVVGLVGCTTTNAGTPIPTSGDGSISTSTPTTQAVSGNWWKSVNACTLLDQATATQLGYPQPGQIQDGDKRNCLWTASDGSVIGVVLEGQAYNYLPADNGQHSDMVIAGRPAKQDAGAYGDHHACAISIKATEGSDALVTVNTLSSTVAQACSMAQTIGAAIAPKLPGGSK